MTALVVDVVFRGRVLDTVPLRAPVLRIGRMPENDVVLDNLGVSRFHARLRVEEDGVLLEDAGSENGCLVNGERLAGPHRVAAGDVIAIGKHELRLRRAADGDLAEPRPGRRKSDAWDGARTYVLDAPSARIQPTPQPRTEPKEPAAMAPIPAPQSAPIANAGSPDDAHEIDFDFDGSLADGAELESHATEPVDPTPPSAPLHAGFIVQRQGKLERVVAWTGDALVAGRSADCDVQLAQDEVSRRHVRFERVAGRYEVVDLGSVNGTFVNGKRIERHALEVGDVVQVEGFQLTFVLDRDPLDAAIAAKPAPTSHATRGDTFFAMTMLQEEMPERAGLAAAPAAEAPTLSPEADVAEVDLLPEEIDGIEVTEPDEKPAEEIAVRGSSRASSVQDLGRTSQPNLDAPQLRFELRVRLDLLPPALRKAFEEAGASELVLPAELCIRK